MIPPIPGNNPNDDRRIVPLIVFFAFIILMSVVILALRKNFSEKKEAEQKKGTETSIRFSAHHSEFYRDLQDRMESVVQNQAAQKTMAEEEEKSYRKKTIIPPLDLSLARVQSFLELGKQTEAMDLLQTLLIFYPEAVPVLRLYASQLFVSGDLKKAEFYFRKQLQLTPNDPLSLNDLGLVLAKNGQYEAAVSCIERAIVFYPAFPLSEVNLSGVYARSGNTEKALIYLRKACKRLGKQILPLVEDDDFDSIRKMPEFIKIIQSAAKQELK